MPEPSQPTIPLESAPFSLPLSHSNALYSSFKERGYAVLDISSQVELANSMRLFLLDAASSSFDECEEIPPSFSSNPMNVNYPENDNTPPTSTSLPRLQHSKHSAAEAIYEVLNNLGHAILCTLGGDYEGEPLSSYLDPSPLPKPSVLKGCSNLSISHYSPPDSNNISVPHSGLLTLVYSLNSSGLEVQLDPSNDEFTPLACGSRKIVIFTGATLSHLTQGRMRLCKHRVKAPSSSSHRSLEFNLSGMRHKEIVVMEESLFHKVKDDGMDSGVSFKLEKEGGGEIKTIYDFQRAYERMEEMFGSGQQPHSSSSSIPSSTSSPAAALSAASESALSLGKRLREDKTEEMDAQKSPKIEAADPSVICIGIKEKYGGGMMLFKLKAATRMLVMFHEWFEFRGITDHLKEDYRFLLEGERLLLQLKDETVGSVGLKDNGVIEVYLTGSIRGD